MLPPSANIQLLARLPEKNIEKAVYEAEQDRLTRDRIICSRTPGVRVNNSLHKALLSWILNRPVDVQVQPPAPQPAKES